MDKAPTGRVVCAPIGFGALMPEVRGIIEERHFMKKQLLATAALLAVTAHGQLAGPNRPGPGTSPGTFSPPQTVIDPPSTVVRPPATITSPPGQVPATVPPATSSFQTLPPVVNDTPAAINNSAITRPFATDPVVGPRNGVLPNTAIGTPNGINPDSADIRARSSFNGGAINDSTAWDTNAAGAAGSFQSGTDSAGQRLTPPSSTGPIETTTGVRNPPRIMEQPLDRAMSAKVRAQLSATQPVGSQPLPPELIRDLRITTQNGRVVLEGAVASVQQREQIERLVRQVQGVSAIEDRLTLNGRAVGGAAGSQIGSSTNATTNVPSTGQSPQNRSDLDGLSDNHPEIAPDK
jgi:hypothetical protein